MSNPEFEKIVAPATELEVPSSDTAFTPPATVSPVVSVRFPCTVTVPFAAVSASVAALTALLAVTSSALVTVSVVSAVDPPTASTNVTSPVPAVMPRDCAPLTVLANDTLPAPVESSVAPVSCVADPKSIEAAVSVPELLARLMLAAFPADRAPDSVPLAFRVRVPASWVPSNPPMVRAPRD